MNSTRTVRISLLIVAAAILPSCGDNTTIIQQGGGSASLQLLSPNGGGLWETGTPHLVTWSSQGSVGNVDIEFSYDQTTWSVAVAGTPNDGAQSVVAPAASSQVWVRVSESGGTVEDQSVLAVAPSPGAQFSDSVGGLTGVDACSQAWGDYDNDGDLDLALAGFDGAVRITRIYRSNGGWTFTDIVAGLIGVNIGSLAWGDYDNDGDLDLALAGFDGGGAISRIYRNDAGTFNDSGAVPTGVYNCSLAWGDYDNDGDLDLALAGFDGGGRISRIYRNDAGTFIDLMAGLPGVYACSLAWGDYDNDGDLDLALAGETTSPFTAISRIYRNDAGTFNDLGAGLREVSRCSLAWGDYDNDGDLDLALAGNEAAVGGFISLIYRNNAGAFTDIGAGLTGVNSCSLVWGDYDNDGDLDLALAGSPGPISRIYRNDAGTFTDIVAGLKGVSVCSLAWGDIDNDGDLDLALAGNDGFSGRISRIHRNNGADRNTRPGAPAGLGATPAAGSVSLAWGTAADVQTPAPGLSYNLRIGTTAGSQNRYPSMADATGGLRRVPAQAPFRLQATITLPAGTYFWSVQAVDSGFQGSGWAPEQSFTIP